MYTSLHVCVFELDIAVKYKGYILAFEIQGEHYNRNLENDEKVGKKKLKAEILSFSGVKTVDIYCGDKEVKLMMRFNNTIKAKEYILNKIESVIAQP